MIYAENDMMFDARSSNGATPSLATYHDCAVSSIVNTDSVSNVIIDVMLTT